MQTTLTDYTNYYNNIYEKNNKSVSNPVFKNNNNKNSIFEN